MSERMKPRRHRIDGDASGRHLKGEGAGQAPPTAALEAT